MKTETMKNEFVGFLDSLGIAWKFAINGLIGGAVWSLYKKVNFWTAVRQVIVGGIVSGYTTPFIISKGLSVESAGFISFVLGITGMTVVEVIYKSGINKLKTLFDKEQKIKKS